MQNIDSITETVALEGELDFENEIFWTGGDTVFKSFGSVQSLTVLSGIQFSRRSVKSVFGRNGSLAEVMPDAPAVQHDCETGKNPRLLIEKAAVNLFRNPGWRGLKTSAEVSAKPIADGNYIAAAALGGIIESISAGAELGMEYAELTMRATTGAQASFKLILAGSGGPSAIQIEGGTQYTCSAFLRAVSGGENLVSCYWRCVMRDASGAVNSTYNGLDGRFQARSSALFRLESSDPPLIPEASSCSIQPYLQIILEGESRVRLRIYHHQCEPGSLATSPIVQGSKYPYARAPDVLRIASGGHKTKGFTVHVDARAEGDAGVILATGAGHALIEKRGRFMAASTGEDYRAEAATGVGSLNDAVPRKFTLCHSAGKTALKVSEGRTAVVKSKIHHLDNMVLASSSRVEISRLAWWPHGAYFDDLDDAHPPRLRTDPPPAAKPARARATAARKLTQSNRVVHFIPVYLAQSWYLGLYGKKILNSAPTSWRTLMPSMTTFSDVQFGTLRFTQKWEPLRDASLIAGTEALREKRNGFANTGETPATGMMSIVADELDRIMGAAGPYLMVASFAISGSWARDFAPASATQMRSAMTQKNAEPIAELRAALRRIRDLLAANGIGLHVPCVVSGIGYCDQFQPEGFATDWLLAQSAVNTMIKRELKQKTAPSWLSCQTSAMEDISPQDSAAILADLQKLGKLKITAPHYAVLPAGFHRDSLHWNSGGSEQMAKYIGRAIASEAYGSGWMPLAPKAVVQPVPEQRDLPSFSADRRQITVPLHVPTPPLRLDDSTTKPAWQHGLAFVTSDGSDVPIDAIHVKGANLVLTLRHKVSRGTLIFAANRLTTGTYKEDVAFAGYVIGEMPRTSFRDSADPPNWCIHCEIPCGAAAD